MAKNSRIKVPYYYSDIFGGRQILSKEYLHYVFPNLNKVGKVEYPMTKLGQVTIDDLTKMIGYAAIHKS
jgi:hypothetical protein